jgi:hypothetical protein
MERETNESDHDRMTPLARLIIPLAALGISHSTLAGPESGQQFLAETLPQSAITAQEMSVATPFSAETVDSLLVVPDAFQQSSLASDTDLASAEHPMIPLPSHALAAFVMLGAVASYVLRVQRPIRVR